MTEQGQRTTGTASFELTAHEVIRGIRLGGGRLVLRPIGWFIAGFAVEVACFAVVAVLGLAGGGPWVVLSAVALVLTANAVLRARVAVIATPGAVVVRNRFRTRRIEISEINRVGVQVIDRSLPMTLFTRVGRLQVGVLTASGRDVTCDALVSWPPSQSQQQVDPTPTEMKVQCLERWIGHQRCD